MSKREALADKKQRKKVELEDESELQSEEDSDKPAKQVNSDGEIFWALTKYKRVSIGEFKGKVNVNLR